ncbi:zinc ribbon domain-containing protein, partial [Sulfolobus sp. F3]
MQKIYTGRSINIPLLVQEINNLLLSEGWESSMMQNPMPPMMPGMTYYDYTIRAMKKGHLHHVENIIIRVTGQPTDFKIIVEEEHIGPLGRELINHKLFTNIDKQINDGLFDMPVYYQQTPQQASIPQQTSIPQQPMTQGLRCPSCGVLNPPTAK